MAIPYLCRPFIPPEEASVVTVTEGEYGQGSFLPMKIGEPDFKTMLQFAAE